MAKHSPTPWKQESDCSADFEDAKGNYIGSLNGIEKEEDIDFIIKAVNNYLALESRCRELEEVARELYQFTTCKVSDMTYWIDEMWKPALAKAKRLLSKERDNGKD